MCARNSSDEGRALAFGTYKMVAATSGQAVRQSEMAILSMAICLSLFGLHAGRVFCLLCTRAGKPVCVSFRLAVVVMCVWLLLQLHVCLLVGFVVVVVDVVVVVVIVVAAAAAATRHARVHRSIISLWHASLRSALCTWHGASTSTRSCAR